VEPAAVACEARALDVEWLGCIPYAEALELQRKRVEECAAGVRGDALLLLEHPPVITLGRGARPGNVLRSAHELARRGIEIHRVARGGDVTYHGPGQLVGYLITRLDGERGPDLPGFLRRIEAALVGACEDLGVPARTQTGLTGVFADAARSGRPGGPARKLASIGVGVRRWVSYHGFALNVDLDLAGFDDIVPCGLRDVEMTSLAIEAGASWAHDAAGVRERVARRFRRSFPPAG